MQIVVVLQFHFFLFSGLHRNMSCRLSGIVFLFYSTQQYPVSDAWLSDRPESLYFRFLQFSFPVTHSSVCSYHIFALCWMRFPQNSQRIILATLACCLLHLRCSTCRYTLKISHTVLTLCHRFCIRCCQSCCFFCISYICPLKLVLDLRM